MTDYVRYEFAKTFDLPNGLQLLMYQCRSEDIQQYIIKCVLYYMDGGSKDDFGRPNIGMFRVDLPVGGDPAVMQRMFGLLDQDRATDLWGTVKPLMEDKDLPLNTQNELDSNDAHTAGLHKFTMRLMEDAGCEMAYCDGCGMSHPVPQGSVGRTH